MGKRFIARVGAAQIVAALVLVCGAAGQVPRPGTGTSNPRAPEKVPNAVAGMPGGPLFEFHNGFWLNLHLFLYQNGRVLSERRISRPTAQAAPPGAEVAGSEALPEGERAAWQAAVEYYAATLASRDLQFDGEMSGIQNRLIEMEGKVTLERTGLRAPHVRALEEAAPVYRARWWPEHERANREWIEAIGPYVERFGLRLAFAFSRIYRAPWPGAAVRVDVTVYAGPLGAYALLEETLFGRGNLLPPSTQSKTSPVRPERGVPTPRVTVSSVDTRNQGAAAMEVLFHETSHALADGIRESIADEARLRNKLVPRDLWHALIFYTTGSVMARELPGYVPYARQNRLELRGWQNFERVLDRVWRPYLDGVQNPRTYERTISRLVANL